MKLELTKSGHIQVTMQLTRGQLVALGNALKEYAEKSAVGHDVCRELQNAAVGNTTFWDLVK